MARETSAFRVLTDLLVPGGVLVAAAWALQKEEIVRDAAMPYAGIFAFGGLAAAVLLSWYHDQSRLLSAASAVALTAWALLKGPDDSNVSSVAVIFLLPLNFILFAFLRESRVMTVEGLLTLGVVALQATVVAWMIGPAGQIAESLVPELRQTSLPLYAIAAFVLLILSFRRRTKPELALFWALLAMFLGIQDQPGPRSLPFYAGAAGLVLMLAVLEHGYDFAYRDELTGLLGRRAFNTMMGQLRRTYAIAMFDVDHFKRFNDTYGHDAGDQVLKMVATKLSQVGGGGRVFRYGGEEFLVVFRGHSASEAAPFADAVRQAIAEAGFVLRGPDRPAKKPADMTPAEKNRSTVSITVSIGIAERSTRHSTPELVLDAADSALYHAKEAGRNCVKLAD